MKKVALQVALLTGFGLAAGAANASLSTGEMIIVHPFQWTYDNIAKECTEVLGPSGYDGVQISQPAEHIARTDVWWAVYQPVNFNNFTTMTGNEQQLRNMIKTCHAAGVKVFADAVFNQRGSAGSTGLGGSNFNGNQNNPSYPDLNADDFHRNNCSIDYGNAWTIRNCALSGMPDIATDNPSTQDKIAGYLKNLMSMGVDGFRIDAAKHMQPSDIQAILGKAGNPPAYLEVIGADREPVQPTDYTGIPNSVVTEFRYCGAMMGNWQNDAAKVKYLLGMNDSWFQLKSNQAEVFVNNHDNERGSAGTSYMTYKWGALYNLAQSFMVAYPWGQLRQVYSGYEFSAHDPGGPLWADRCTGGWLCQHRVPFVQNAVSFARATRGEGVTNTGSEGKVIWFSRGNKGFYVLNATNSDVTKSFKTNMPDGTYKEILGQSDRSAGADITVSGGMATITVKGMSAADISDKWLFIAYSAKSDGTEDNNYRSKIRRDFAGAKGIGRLSCDRLARYLTMNTVSEETDTLEILKVDWAKFENRQKENIDTIPVEHESTNGNYVFPDNSSHGTSLSFTGLHGKWGVDEIFGLRKSLEKMIAPLAGADDFQIEVIAPNFTEYDNQLRTQINGAREHYDDLSDQERTQVARWENSILNGPIRNSISDVLKIKTTQIESKLRDGKIVTRLSDRGVLMYEIEEDNKYSKLEEASVDLYYLNRAAKYNFSLLMGMTPVNYGNVFLFRNGFRIMPYGEYDDDSWGLNQRSQQGYNRNLSTRDLFGRVDVHSDDVNMFKEVSSRDGGLIDSEETRQLHAYFDAVERRLERYVSGVLWGEAFLRNEYFACK